MDVNELIKILKDNENQLNHILDDCKEGSAQLILLASKMDPILENFSFWETELSSSISDNHATTEQANEADICPQK